MFELGPVQLPVPLERSPSDPHTSWETARAHRKCSFKTKHWQDVVPPVPPSLVTVEKSGGITFISDTSWIFHGDFLQSQPAKPMTTPTHNRLTSNQNYQPALTSTVAKQHIKSQLKLQSSQTDPRGGKYKCFSEETVCLLKAAEIVDGLNSFFYYSNVSAIKLSMT